MNQNYIPSSQPSSSPDPAPSSVPVPPQVPEVQAETPASAHSSHTSSQPSSSPDPAPSSVPVAPLVPEVQAETPASAHSSHTTAQDNLRTSSGDTNSAPGGINLPAPNLMISSTVVGQGLSYSTGSPQVFSQHKTTAVDAGLGNVLTEI